MHIKSKLSLALLATAAGLAGTASAQTDIIYREIFGRNTATSISLSNFGWSVYAGATALNNTTSAATYSVTGDATPTNYTNITSAAAVQSIFAPNNVYTSVTNGRTLFGGTGIFIAFTNEYAIDRSVWNVTGFSWDQRADNAALGVVVQIENEGWFVSSTVTTGMTGTAWNTTYETAAKVNFNTTTWSSLNFVPNTAVSPDPANGTLSIGSTTTLPGGKILAFGIYGPSTRGAAARIDGFTVEGTAIPEPASVAALSGLGVFGFVALRRRRQDAR